MMQVQHAPPTVWSKIKLFAVKHGFAVSLLMPAFIYTAFFTIIIIFSLLQLSLSGAESSGFPTLANYSEIVHSADFWDALWRTVVFVLLGTPLQLIAGLVLAIVINREFVGRGIVRSIFLLPIAIPSIVTAVIAAFMLFSYPFGHINDILLGKLFMPQVIDQPINWYTSSTTALGLSLFAKVWRDMPISMLILLAGLQSIGRDQYEAAQSMGASALQQFSYITVPLLVPAISTVLILRSIEVWKEFLFPFIIAPTYPILGVLIDYFYHEQRSPAKAAALSIILLVLISAFTWMISRLLKSVQQQLVKV